MREIVSISLLMGLIVCGTGNLKAESHDVAETASADAKVPSDVISTEQASNRIVDMLFSDEIDRIDIRATTFEDAQVLVQTTSGRILDLCVPLLGEPGLVAERSAEVIEALNTSAARGLVLTFSKTKQDLVVESLDQANDLGEIVGETIAIIHGHYGSGDVSYRDKATNLFSKVRLNPEDSESMLLRHLETVQHVKGSTPAEQRKYLN